jgi:hypothetical protein
MRHIDESRLEQDPQYRFDYLAEFIGFGPEDAALIQGSGPYLGPMIPQLVDETYAKLLAFDATARHFVPRQTGYEGPLTENIESLSMTDPQIQFRKEHLAKYFMQVLGRAFDQKMVVYLDMVGKIHTPKAGSAEIDVPLVQMNALMGLLAVTISEAIANQISEAQLALRTIRAFEKFLWIQNDFITRHYQNTGDDSPRGRALTQGNGRAIPARATSTG